MDVGVDPTYQIERTLYVAIFCIFIALFAAQNYIRVKHTMPKQSLFAFENAKCVNHLAGLLGAFWYAILFMDSQHVHYRTNFALSIGIEFSFVAGSSTLISGYVQHMAIALKALSGNGHFKTNVETHRGAFMWLGRQCHRKVYGPAYWICQLTPWTAALTMLVLMTQLDRAYVQTCSHFVLSEHLR